MTTTDQQPATSELSDASRSMLAIEGAVFDYWEAQVRQRIHAARDLAGPILTNTLPAFYGNIVEAVTSAYPRADGTSNTDAASAHGGERARMTVFRADQVVHEYQIFREAIAVVAQRHGVTFSTEEWRVVEVSIESALREAVREFALIHDGLRERLAASLSHDMRNPLALIMAATQLIAASPTLDIAQRPAQKIAAAARRLEQMLVELVDALTFERGMDLPLAISEFDIRELLQAIAQEFRLTSTSDIQLEVSRIMGFWCKNSMRRAIENLLTNALKYGDGGSVTIKADANRGRLMLSVHNAGNPIAQSQRERIFDYLRRENTATGVSGWGIGLPFVRNVAESHGGSVAVDSSSDTGTTFLIDIPIDCRQYVKLAIVAP